MRETRLTREGAVDVVSIQTMVEALIHSLRGLDEEGLATLHEADAIALANHDHETVSRARAEIGYVDFLRARYDRAVRWLTEGLEYAAGSTGFADRIQGLARHDGLRFPAIGASS